MSDNNVLKLSQPSTFSDPLTEVLRSGARSLLARAVEAEVAAFLDGHSEARTEEGRRRLVRHGHLPEREIMTGIGPVAVRAPRVRDRTGQGADRIRFSSALLPPYARRSKSLEVLIPVLYLKGISTGDFAEALAALLGPDAGGLSASTVARLTEVRRTSTRCGSGATLPRSPSRSRARRRRWRVRARPRLGALAHPVDEAYEFLLTLRRRADDDQQALRIVLEPGLHMDAVGPETDTFAAALADASMFALSGLSVATPSATSPTFPRVERAFDRRHRNWHGRAGDRWPDAPANVLNPPTTPRLGRMDSSPQPVDAVTVEHRIDRHDCQIARQGLGDEHPVERITMRAR